MQESKIIGKRASYGMPKTFVIERYLRQLELLKFGCIRKNINKLGEQFDT